MSFQNDESQPLQYPHCPEKGKTHTSSVCLVGIGEPGTRSSVWALYGLVQLNPAWVLYGQESSPIRALYGLVHANPIRAPTELKHWLWYWDVAILQVGMASPYIPIIFFIVLAGSVKFPVLNCILNYEVAGSVSSRAQQTLIREQRWQIPVHAHTYHNWARAWRGLTISWIRYFCCRDAPCIFIEGVF